MARRRFSRPLGERRYKKLFVLATEGTETEPRYFKMFEAGDKVIHVQLLKGGNQSSPPQVLRRMNCVPEEGRPSGWRRSLAGG